MGEPMINQPDQKWIDSADQRITNVCRAVQLLVEFQAEHQRQYHEWKLKACGVGMIVSAALAAMMIGLAIMSR